MAEVRSVRLDKQQIEALSRMEGDELADNQTEALRRVIDAGLAEHGYLDGREADTDLRQTARSIGFVFAMVGAFAVGLAFFGPLTSRLLAFTPWVMSLGCYALDRGLKHYEPSVSARLGLLGGERV